VYTAKQTRDFATALNLIPCFTPVKSPESNGMSEAFVKTFKRDHLRMSPLPDAPSVLWQIAGWIDDYNEIHPHSACAPRGSSSGPKPSSRVSGEMGHCKFPIHQGCVRQVLQKGGHDGGHAAGLSMIFLCSLRSSILT